MPSYRRRWPRCPVIRGADAGGFAAAASAGDGQLRRAGATLEGCTFPNPPATCTSIGAPPYPSGAAGPNHYVQVVNGGIAIWNKSGTLVTASRRTQPLWYQYVGSAGNGCFAQNDGQANVLYDYPGRWVISQLSLPNLDQNASPSFVCIGGLPDERSDRRLLPLRLPVRRRPQRLPAVRPRDRRLLRELQQLRRDGLIGANVCALDRNRMISGPVFHPAMFLGPEPGLWTLAGDPRGVRRQPGRRRRVRPFHERRRGRRASSISGSSTLTSRRRPTARSVGPFPTPSPRSRPTCGTAATLHSAAEPGNTLIRGVRPPDAAARLPQLRDPRVADRQPQRLRRRRGWRALVRAALALRDAHGLPARDLRADDGSWRFMGSAAQDAGGNIALGFTVSSTTTTARRWHGRARPRPIRPGRWARARP